MPTFKQLGYKKKRVRRIVPNHLLDLEKCPQKSGVCIRTFIRAPKKPCSANRPCAKIKLHNKRRTKVMVHIPGETHNLKAHGIVLIRGAPVPDLPGVKYRVIRNVGKGNSWIERRRQPSQIYSLLGLDPTIQSRARSKYGIGNIYRPLHLRREKMKEAAAKKVIVPYMDIKIQTFLEEYKKEIDNKPKFEI
jgi:small subunit ribosomal protein S12